jgi:hypothetical protein
VTVMATNHGDGAGELSMEESDGSDTHGDGEEM